MADFKGTLKTLLRYSNSVLTILILFFVIPLLCTSLLLLIFSKNKVSVQPNSSTPQAGRQTDTQYRYRQDRCRDNEIAWREMSARRRQREVDGKQTGNRQTYMQAESQTDRQIDGRLERHRERKRKENKEERMRVWRRGFIIYFS